MIEVSLITRERDAYEFFKNKKKKLEMTRKKDIKFSFSNHILFLNSPPASHNFSILQPLFSFAT